MYTRSPIRIFRKIESKMTFSTPYFDNFLFFFFIFFFSEHTQRKKSQKNNYQTKKNLKKY